MSPPAEQVELLARFLLGLFFSQEYGGDTFLRNVS
jgi:hypothetical protein